MFDLSWQVLPLFALSHSLEDQERAVFGACVCVCVLATNFNVDNIISLELKFTRMTSERSGSVVECSTRDRGVALVLFVSPLRQVLTYSCRYLKVSKGAKIRNRYNQVPHLTQDTNGKVTSSQQTPQTRAKRSALPQQVTTKHI